MRRLRHYAAIAMGGAALLLAPCGAAQDQGASFRPPSGAEIIPRGAAGGLGVLQVSNAADQDAVLKLRSGGLWRMVYVRAHERATVQNVKPGPYTLLFTSGGNWDNKGLKFRDHPIYFQFEKPLTFTETRAPDGGTEAVRSEITLVAIPQGNTDVKPIRDKDF